jgi:hypothetical protein
MIKYLFNHTVTLSRSILLLVRYSYFVGPFLVISYPKINPISFQVRIIFFHFQPHHLVSVNGPVAHLSPRQSRVQGGSVTNNPGNSLLLHSITYLQSL